MVNAFFLALFLMTAAAFPVGAVYRMTPFEVGREGGTEGAVASGSTGREESRRSSQGPWNALS